MTRQTFQAALSDIGQRLERTFRDPDSASRRVRITLLLEEAALWGARYAGSLDAPAPGRSELDACERVLFGFPLT